MAAWSENKSQQSSRMGTSYLASDSKYEKLDTTWSGHDWFTPIDYINGIWAPNDTDELTYARLSALAYAKREGIDYERPL